jgi:hypothetical protein
MVGIVGALTLDRLIILLFLLRGVGKLLRDYPTLRADVLL